MSAFNYKLTRVPATIHANSAANFIFKRAIAKLCHVIHMCHVSCRHVKFNDVQANGLDVACRGSSQQVSKNRFVTQVLNRG